MNSRIVFRLLAACSAAGCLFCAATPVRAIVQTNVPMQGGMVMPMISYDSGDGMLHVAMPTNIPQLTPLLVSNPSDTFDPADPWYNSLDPYRQGLAFSRRYGFVMDAMSDPLPAGTAIWIRKLSGPPALEVYRYSGTTPKTWQPVFGTAGSSNALYWNGMMFHPCFAAPPGTNAWVASFEAYLVNTNTLVEMPETGTGVMTFNFTDVPDGRPSLDIAMKFAIVWPANTSNYVLEAADSLTATNWAVVTNVATTIDGQPAVILGTGGGKFFRMKPSP